MASEYFLPSSPGGAEKSLFQFARHLGKRGHAVGIVTFQLIGEDDGEIAGIDDELAAAGDIDVKRVPLNAAAHSDNSALASYVFGNPRLHRRYALELENEIDAFRPDIVHAQGYDSYESALKAARQKGVACAATVRDYRTLCPVSICLHTGDEAPKNCAYGDFRRCCGKYLENYGIEFNMIQRAKHDWRRLLEWRNSREAKKALRAVDGALFVSRRIMDIYSAAGLAPKISEVVYNLSESFDFETDDEKEDSRFDFGDKKIVVFAGRYSLGKGAKELTEAMKIAGRAKPELRCMIAGRRESGLQTENMEFLGVLPHSELHRLYRRSEMIVLPSRWQEPLSRVLIEAGRAGRPVVASDAGGNSEVVVDGYNGRLVPRNDPEALAAAILELLNMSEENKRRMSLAAKKRAAELFDARSIIEKTENFYRRIMDRAAV